MPLRLVFAYLGFLDISKRVLSNQSICDSTSSISSNFWICCYSSTRSNLLPNLEGIRDCPYMVPPAVLIGWLRIIAVVFADLTVFPA